MEIVIAIVVVVIGAVLYFNRKPKTEATVEVPYKVETPVVEEAKAPRAKKAPAAKKTATKKTATIKPVTRKPKAK